jgi:predicted nucleic acid-binding protein
MIVVADTSPINYLILIEKIDILSALFGEVIIPRAVYQELVDTGAPDRVKAWMNQLPDWLEVRTPSRIVERPIAHLDRGEYDAILIAEEIHAGRLIIDDRKGRREARKRGIQTIGTLAVLELASAAGLLDLAESIERLQRTTFFVPAALIARFLKRDT